MGGPQEQKWPQICSNSKHKKVLIVRWWWWVGPDNRVTENPGNGPSFGFKYSCISGTYHPLFTSLTGDILPDPVPDGGDGALRLRRGCDDPGVDLVRQDQTVPVEICSWVLLGLEYLCVWQRAAKSR